MFQSNKKRTLCLFLLYRMAIEMCCFVFNPLPFVSFNSSVLLACFSVWCRKNPQKVNSINLIWLNARVIAHGYGEMGWKKCVLCVWQSGNEKELSFVNVCWSTISCRDEFEFLGPCVVATKQCKRKTENRERKREKKAYVSLRERNSLLLSRINSFSLCFDLWQHGIGSLAQPAPIHDGCTNN